MKYHLIKLENVAAQEFHLLPTSSMHPLTSSQVGATESSQVGATEPTTKANINSYKAEEIGSQPLRKDCVLNGNASLKHMDSVQTLNTDVSVAEDIGSMTFTGLVTIGGYRVKGEVAPLLGEILSEHGDIASECILQTSEYRASLLESVCTIYQELEPKVPNITSIEVDNMQARIKDLEGIRLNVKCLQKRLEEFFTMKTLFEKTRSLNEARARCMESIERKEKILESLEQEFKALQQKISSEKTELALLKTEAETIESSLQTMVKTETLQEQFMVPVSTLHDNNQITTETNGDLPPETESIAYLTCQSYDPAPHSQLHLNTPYLEYYEQRPDLEPQSQDQSISRNLQRHCSQSNLLADFSPLNLYSAKYNSENESDQNYEMSSEDVNHTNIPGCNNTSGESPSGRGTPNQGSSFVESSRKNVRGKSMTRHGWGTGKKMMLQLNEHNQVIGNLAAPFASQLGVLSRDGKKLPLTYRDWRAVPEIYKERMWQEVKDNTNLQDDCKSIILGKIAKNWRSWKCTVKELYLIPYFNDNEKLARHPEDDRVEKDQWPILVSFWKSKAALEVCKQNKINRKNSKRVHRSGRSGFAIVKEKMKERGIEGDIEQSLIKYDGGEEVETKKRQTRNEELEPERPSQVQPYTPEMTLSKVRMSTKMKLLRVSK